MKAINEYYPTPIELIAKMLKDSSLDRGMSILEPSAGKGNIVDYIKTRLDARGQSIREDYDIDSIEINTEFTYILRGKGYRVVHDDFLTYDTQKRYDLIIMNPPFSQGDKHLLKALELAKDGGTVVCLLNAETLRNQYSNYRAALATRLEELDAEIEYIQGAFASAERKTGVEIALIKVKVPAANNASIILDELKKTYIGYGEFRQGNDIVSSDVYERNATTYRVMVEAAVRFINEYYRINEILPCGIFKLVQNENDFFGYISRCDFINGTVEKIRGECWERFFRSKEISCLMTENLSRKFYDKLNDLKNYDVTVHNIYALTAEIRRTMAQDVEECIVGLFDELSNRHAYTEYSKNIHYFDGWKTNKAWYINKKVILPLNVFDEWRGTYNYYPTRAERKLSDIEKALNYLDAGRTEDIDIHERLLKARDKGETRKIPFKFFTATFYKKGTTHIEFTDTELLKKFNIFGSRKKCWLPPSYGKARYEDMTAEERKAVDSFEGEDDYRKVYNDPERYIYSVSQMPLLECGEV